MMWTPACKTSSLPSPSKPVHIETCANATGNIPIFGTTKEISQSLSVVPLGANSLEGTCITGPHQFGDCGTPILEDRRIIFPCWNVVFSIFGTMRWVETRLSHRLNLSSPRFFAWSGRVSPLAQFAIRSYEWVKALGRGRIIHDVG